MTFYHSGWAAKKNVSIGREPGFYCINLSSSNFDFPQDYSGENIAIVDLCGFYEEATTIDYDGENQSGWMMLRKVGRTSDSYFLLYKGGLAKNPLHNCFNYTVRSDEREIYHAYAPSFNSSKCLDLIGNSTADVYFQQVSYSFSDQPAWRLPPTKVVANMSLGEDIEFDLWIKLEEYPTQETAILEKKTGEDIQLGIYIDADGCPQAKANIGPYFVETENTSVFPLHEYHLLLGRIVRADDYLFKVDVGFQNRYDGVEIMVPLGSGKTGSGDLTLEMKSGSAEVAMFRVWQGKTSPSSLFDSYKGFVYRGGKLYHIDKPGAGRGIGEIS